MNKLKNLGTIAAAVVAFVALLAACAAATPAASPSSPAAEYTDMPNGGFAMQTFCSHGFRIWQSWHDGGASYGGNSSVALTSQPDPSCAAGKPHG